MTDPGIVRLRWCFDEMRPYLEERLRAFIENERLHMDTIPVSVQLLPPFVMGHEEIDYRLRPEVAQYNIILSRRPEGYWQRVEITLMAAEHGRSRRQLGSVGMIPPPLRAVLFDERLYFTRSMLDSLCQLLIQLADAPQEETNHD